MFMKLKHLWACALLLVSSVASAQTYEELVEKAEAMIQVDSLQTAEKLLKQALSKEPANFQNAVLFANLGLVQERMNKRVEALESYTMALNRIPDNVRLLMNRGTLFLEEGELNRAYLDFSKVVELEPENITALQNRAYISFHWEDYKSACEDYKKILTLDADNHIAKFGWAIAEEKAGNIDKALLLIDELLAVQKDDVAWLYEARANILFAQKRYDEARVDIDKALELDVSLRTAYITRGDILLAQKKTELAKKDYEKALELGVPFAEIQARIRECR